MFNKIKWIGFGILTFAFGFYMVIACANGGWI